jgi:hypothetical protein
VVMRLDLLLAAQRPELELQSIRTLTQQLPALPSSLRAAEALRILDDMEAPLGVVVTPDYPVGFISQTQVYAKLAQLPAMRWPSKVDPDAKLRPSASPNVPRNAA